jgi:CO/xanthine dehydrogenase FAD-binding subunit
VKPPPFDYFAPRSLDEALALLDEFGGEARVLAGGQSLVPLMNMRLASPRRIIDINRIAQLNYVELKDGYLCLGALTRHRTIEQSPLVAAVCPLLARAASFIGHAQVRTRGTIGGSLSHADPAAEYPAVVAVLDGEIVAQSRRGRRVMSWQEFFLAPYTVDLRPDEMVVEICLPKPAQPVACAFFELSRRQGDFALVEAAAQIQIDSLGKYIQVNIGLGGVGGVPVRALAVERFLQGQTPDVTQIQKAAQMAADGIEPDDDLHASAGYRKKMSSLLVGRALEQATRLASRENR